MDKWSLYLIFFCFMLIGFFVYPVQNPYHPSEEHSKPKPTPEQKALDFAKSVGYSPNKIVCGKSNYCWVFVDKKIFYLYCNLDDYSEMCSLRKETNL